MKKDENNFSYMSNEVQHSGSNRNKLLFGLKQAVRYALVTTLLTILVSPVYFLHCKNKSRNRIDHNTGATVYGTEDPQTDAMLNVIGGIASVDEVKNFFAELGYDPETVPVEEYMYHQEFSQRVIGPALWRFHQDLYSPILRIPSERQFLVDSTKQANTVPQDHAIYFYRFGNERLTPLLAKGVEGRDFGEAYGTMRNFVHLFLKIYMSEMAHVKLFDIERSGYYFHFVQDILKTSKLVCDTVPWRCIDTKCDAESDVERYDTSYYRKYSLFPLPWTDESLYIDGAGYDDVYTAKHSIEYEAHEIQEPVLTKHFLMHYVFAHLDWDSGRDIYATATFFVNYFDTYSDHVLALSFLEKAAEKGSLAAMRDLQTLYRTGIYNDTKIGEPDYVQAAYWKKVYNETLRGK